MAQIKQLKDTTGNFYPVTHKDAVVGIEDIQVDMTGYATEQWVEEQNYLKEHQDVSNKVDVSDFEEATKVTAATLNFFHSNTLWQTEDTYVKCDKSKTLEEAISGESNIVYFTTDNNSIIVNGKSYGKRFGGYVYLEEYGTDFQTALTAALAAIPEGTEDATIIDCTYFKGQHTVTSGFTINNPVKLIFGGINVTYNNPGDSNFFTINSNDVSIIGINRNTDKNSVSTGATTFTMTGSENNDNLNGYHIKSKGYKNILIQGLTLKGVRTSMGHQYLDPNYPLDGVGGIYIEKENPAETSGGITCNNTRIENVLIAGSKAHGIYIDTPILSTIKNVRVSDCGGHGIFLSGGTSTMLENVYSSSANMAGFCIYGSTYVQLNNCVAENSGVGFWLRSAREVTLQSPGVEQTKTYGAQPWRNTSNGKVGLGLKTSGVKDGQAVDVFISDVSNSQGGYFIGYGILITGGQGINIFTPYVKSIAVPVSSTAGYPNGTSISNKVRYIEVADTARAVYILNPTFKETEGSTIPTTIRNEISIGDNTRCVDLVYDTDSSVLVSDTPLPSVVNNTNDRAPIYCNNSTAIIRSAEKHLTGITAESFKKIGSSDDYVLLGGGGTKLLSEISSGGGSGEVSGYLPLTGGTMSGNITMPEEVKLIFGNTSVYSNGDLFIGDDLQVDGIITANGFKHAANTSNDYVLLAGGGLMSLSDIQPNVDLSGYLPLTGGDMSGNIGFGGDCGVIGIIETEGLDRIGWLRVYGEEGVAIEGQTHIDGPLEVSMDINATAFYETSDARKKDIKSDLSLDKCYDLIDKCQTVIYSLKDQTKEQVGMIAQEIEEFFPEVVATDEEGFKSLAYDRLVVICFKVLKDVIKRLEKLENV